jgi:galactofuranosylgalactofuranosylrhamnosyl-N-acetylglucosaminyl-diphospho-decaprenol beta-1,5/1,6-galactofuranosyltransferase
VLHPPAPSACRARSGPAVFTTRSPALPSVCAVATASDRENTWALVREADRADTWTAVQDVIGPLEGGVQADALYVAGGALGGVVPTGSGRRATLIVPAATTASFGVYFNAFPTAVWRASTTASRVRLELHLDGAAIVRLIRSDARGARVAEQAARTGSNGAVALETPLGSADGGYAWFEITARSAAVTVLAGAWSVDAPPLRTARAVLGMPTMDRGPFVAANLRRLVTAPELLASVARVVVVDQGTAPVAADRAVADVAAALGGTLRVIRQPNLGGAGGFSRVMLEASEEPGADVVTLLDDDIELEPASLLRALAFGSATRIPTIVGGQQLDLARPGTVQAAAELVLPEVFWWAPADERTSTHDHAAVPLSAAPWLHERRDADYNGWWMCQLPIEAVRRLGLALPLFLKWDDAEYGLRAAAAGVPTVSLPGAAVWHVAFRSKDDSVEWQAFFHARNRVIAAVLHGGSAAHVVCHSLALDVKQLLAMQYPASRLRHAGLRAALAGPGALGRDGDLARARGIAAVTPALPRLPPDAAEDARPVPGGGVGPVGARLGRWTVVTLLRSLAAGASDDAVRAPRAEWWVLARYGRVYAPTADDEAVFRFVRDRRALLHGLTGSLLLHGRLLTGWRRLAGRYSAAAPSLASADAWRRRFPA